MAEATPATRYNAVAVLIHWLTAIAIVGMLVVGWIMEDMPNSDPDKFMLFQAHKSVGITILILSLFRVVWRMTHPVPPMSSAIPLWQRKAAQATHLLFYVLILALPLTGWAVVSTSSFNIPTLLYGVIPWPHLPILPMLENKAMIHEFLGETHGTLASIITALLVLHIGAAWKHHLINRDDTLTRMAPRFLTRFLNRFGGAPLAALGFCLLATPIPAHAASWTVDYAHSHVGFKGKQDVDPFEGGFRAFTATIDFDLAHPESGHIAATIDIASATAGNAERDAYLPQPSWFDTKKFPQARFESTKIQPVETLVPCGGPHSHSYVVSGKLTIKDVAKDITMDACVEIADHLMTAKANVPLIRTDFNLGTGQWSGDDMVRRSVEVAIVITAKGT